LEKLTTALKEVDKEQAEFYDQFLAQQKNTLATLVPEVNRQRVQQFEDSALVLQLRMAELITNIEDDVRSNPAAKEMAAECREMAERFNQLIEDYGKNKDNFSPRFQTQLGSIQDEFNDMVKSTLAQEKYRTQHVGKPSMGFFKGESGFAGHLRAALPESKEVKTIRSQLTDPVLKDQLTLGVIPLEKPPEAAAEKVNLKH
jgi:anti-sigma regulatory factor (Ser/Thr protein kinase)